MGEIEYKALPFERKAVDFEASQFEGFSAGIGNRDDGDDVIMPGAFEKTISERVGAGKVKLLDGHDPWSTRNLWGKVIDAEERTAPRGLPGNPSHVLWTLFDVSRADPDAQTALGKIDEGILDALSIGYRVKRMEYELDDAEEDMDPEIAWYMGRGVRRLHEVAWWETSLVVWGMNEAAVIPKLREVLDIVRNDPSKLSEVELRQTMKSLGVLLKRAERKPETVRKVVQWDNLFRGMDALASSLERLGGIVPLPAGVSKAVGEATERLEKAAGTVKQGRIILPTGEEYPFAVEGEKDDEEPKEAAEDLATVMAEVVGALRDTVAELRSVVVAVPGGERDLSGTEDAGEGGDTPSGSEAQAAETGDAPSGASAGDGPPEATAGTEDDGPAAEDSDEHLGGEGSTADGQSTEGQEPAPEDGPQAAQTQSGAERGSREDGAGADPEAGAPEGGAEAGDEAVDFDAELALLDLVGTQIAMG